MDYVKQSITSEIEKLNTALQENNQLLQDPEMSQLAKEEIEKIKSQISDLEKSLNSLDTNFDETASDQSDDGAVIDPNLAIIEIRAGTGGDEAGLFAGDLYRMYLRYAEVKGYRVEEYFRSENISGGIKTVTAEIKGRGIFKLLQNESGVHRVQRVPVTESGGRIHTSTATVAVLPHIKHVDFEIRPEDLQWDFFRSGGKGGQNVNKVSTAVRLTHVPTQVVVECQEERTQGKNREKALGILQSRLYTAMQEQQVKNLSGLRTAQVGSGDRSEKIRTYNFPQDRITDHRLKLSWHNLAAIMNGEIDDILTSFQAPHQE